MESLLRNYRCTKASEATHLSLVGGKFMIPSLDLFHRMYFKMISSNPAYLVEKVRYPCRWYIDLDKQDPSHLMNFLKEFLRTKGKRCVVSMPNSRDGAHIVFPDIVVTSKEDAIKRTTALLQEEIPFDASVYRSGLRMIGSKKSHKIDRVYSPVFVIQTNGDVTHIDQWTLEHLNDSSIFSGKSENVTSLCEKIPHPILCESVTEQFDFKFIHPEYTNLRVQVKAFKSYINVMTDSHYCMNIQRKHKNNRVFFVIYKHPKTEVVTIHTKCFCTCDHTGCTNYKSPFIRMPMILYFRLKQMLN